MIRQSLGNLYLAMGRLAEAREVIRQTLAKRESILGEEAVGTMNTRFTCGKVAQAMGDYQEAAEHFEKVWLEYSHLYLLNPRGNGHKNPAVIYQKKIKRKDPGELGQFL